MSRIEPLLRAMTLEEKVGQLNLVTAGQAVTGPIVQGQTTADIRKGRVGGVFNLWGREAVAAAQRVAVEGTRLGVPLFFGLDVLHGHRTIFPIPLAEAGIFDPLIWERTARAAAAEAARDGISLTFAPMLDVARDPRWGRIAEGQGEDPMVAARFADAKVRGFQGQSFADPERIAATAKHFCAGGAAIAGLDYAAVDVSARALHEIYLPPFRAAVEAGCAAIMPAFNSVAGAPMTAHRGLLRGYLRGTLGFDGVIISDYTAIAELVQHGVAADLVEAAALALNAGVDMDMVSGAYLHGLPEALSRGLVDAKEIDAAVARVLRLKEKLGLFDDPYRSASRGEYNRAAHRELALDAARRSITLLSNRDILPFSSDARRIALIGPLAEARAEMLGPWSAAGAAENCVTFLEGVRAALPTCEIVCHAGVSIDGDDASGIETACALARGADVVVLCLGEAALMSGEAACRANPGLPGRQRELAEKILSTDAPVVALLSSGRPLTVAWLVARARAVLSTWFLGDMAGCAVAEVLTGRYNPSARLAVTWPRDVGQIPVFHAARSTGRPLDQENRYTSKYLDLASEPLFPFGHGLSYSRVTLSNIRLRKREFRPGETIEATVEAHNEGKITTEETIFLFLHDVVARIARPVMELKAWAKVQLAPGERRTVAFSLEPDSLAYPGEDMAPVIDAGDFEILIGPSADRESLLKAGFRLLSQ